MKDGRSFRAIGANYFDLFSRPLAVPGDRSTLRGLAALKRAGIPFVRFMACGYWPAGWSLYRTNPESYFARLDAVVREAEQVDIGLIPSLFWHRATLPDLAQEPLDQWGNPGSRTRALMREYTRAVVGRYADSPAIWGWEFGNEYNLAADLPNAAEHRPPVWPTLGTPQSRSDRDDLTTTAVADAITEFGRVVRGIDPHRIISTGHAIPRAGAWHNSHEATWTADTRDQYAAILDRDSPDPVDVISVHLYPQPGRYPGRTRTLTECLGVTEAIARRAGRPLFVGEFGAPASMGTKRARAEFMEILDALVLHRVALAAFWVFDRPGKEDAGNWNVSFKNRRAWILRAVANANANLGKSGNHRLRSWR